MARSLTSSLVPDSLSAGSVACESCESELHATLVTGTGVVSVVEGDCESTSVVSSGLVVVTKLSAGADCSLVSTLSSTDSCSDSWFDCDSYCDLFDSCCV